MARALPDLVARIRLDSTGVDSAMSGLVGSFGRANMALAGLAAGIGLLIFGAKSAVEIAEQREAAERSLGQALATQGQTLAKYLPTLEKFIAANRSYIPDQSEVIKGAAILVRSGLSQAEVQKDLNRALDIAALKNISLEEAVSLLVKAEQGRLRGLIDLGISTGKYTNAQGDLINGTKDVGRVMAEVDLKTKDGRKSQTDMAQAVNDLKNDWQDLALVLGPPLLGILDAAIKKVDEFYKALEHAGSSPPSPLLQDTLVGWGLAYQEAVIRAHGPNIPADQRAWYKKNWPAAYAAVYPTVVPERAGGAPSAGPGGFEAGKAYEAGKKTSGAGVTGVPGEVTGITGQGGIGSQLVPLGVATVAAQKETITQLNTVNRNLEKVGVALSQPRTVVYSTVNSYQQTDAQLSAMIARNLRKIGVV